MYLIDIDRKDRMLQNSAGGILGAGELVCSRHGGLCFSLHQLTQLELLLDAGDERMRLLVTSLRTAHQTCLRGCN